MSKYIKAQQAAVDGLSEIGIQATLMVHCSSKINAPKGILLTTYDQLHSQIEKRETTVYAFPSFGATQSVMRTLYLLFAANWNLHLRVSCQHRPNRNLGKSL